MPVDEIDCNIYFDLTYLFSLGQDIPVVTITGRDVLWNYLRRQSEITLSSYNRTFTFLLKQVTLNQSSYNKTFNFLRRQITFYRNFVMANQDPFEISKGGKLVDQRIFLNPLRVAGDELVGAPTSTQSETGFTVDNISINTEPIISDDGLTFPEGTVISFDVEAPGSLGVDLGYEEITLYFEITSVAGLSLTISHPLRVKDAIEVQ